MPFVSHFDGTELEVKMQELAQGRDPVDYHTEMIGPLIFYAQQFERCGAFKEEIGVEKVEYLECQYRAGC